MSARQVHEDVLYLYIYFCIFCDAGHSFRLGEAEMICMSNYCMRISDGSVGAGIQCQT